MYLFDRWFLTINYVLSYSQTLNYKLRQTQSSRIQGKWKETSRFAHLFFSLDSWKCLEEAPSRRDPLHLHWQLIKRKIGHGSSNFCLLTLNYSPLKQRRHLPKSQQLPYAVMVCQASKASVNFTFNWGEWSANLILELLKLAWNVRNTVRLTKYISTYVKYTPASASYFHILSVFKPAVYRFLDILNRF